jgi:hypothetical protein
VNALRHVHAALVQGGLLVDTQPVSADPSVEAAGRRIGALDMSEWRATIDAIDAQAAQTFDDGPWRDEREQRFVVTDTFPTGAALLATVDDWQGTRIPDAVRQQLSRHMKEAAVHQEVRLRILRAL